MIILLILPELILIIDYYSKIGTLEIKLKNNDNYHHVVLVSFARLCCTDVNIFLCEHVFELERK